MEERQRLLPHEGADADTANEVQLRQVKLPRPHLDFLAAVRRATAHPDEYPGVESDGVWLTASQRDLAAICERSKDRVGVYVRDCRGAGFLVTRPSGRRLAYRIDAGMVVDHPDGVPLPKPGRGTPSPRKAPEVSTEPSVPNVDSRREAVVELIEAIRTAALLATIVIFGLPRRRFAVGTTSFSVGDCRQPLLFDSEPTLPTSRPSAFSRRPSSPTASTDVEIPVEPSKPPSSPHAHDHEMKNEMTHDHEACASGVLNSPESEPRNYGWPFPIEKKHLQDPEQLGLLYKHAVSKGWIDDSQAMEQAFAGLAEQALKKFKSKKGPGGLFTDFIKKRKWEIPSSNGGLTQWAEQRAANRRKAAPRKPRPSASSYIDRDANIEREKRRQELELDRRLQGVGSIPGEPKSRTLDAAAH